LNELTCDLSLVLCLEAQLHIDAESHSIRFIKLKQCRPVPCSYTAISSEVKTSFEAVCHSKL